MNKKNPPRLLVSDDLASGAEQESRSAVVRSCATVLAKRIGACLDLVYVDDPDPSLSVAFPKPLMVRYLSDLKMRLRKRAIEMGSEVQTVMLRGEPASKILSLASAKKRYELIIQGTQGKKGLARLFLGSVAEEIVRNAKIPVLTVGPGAQASRQRLLKNEKIRILMPTALTPGSSRAEAYAAAFAKRVGGEIVLFHSIYDSLHPVLQTAFAAPGASSRLKSMRDEMMEDAEKKLSGLAKRLARQGVAVSIVLDSKMNSSVDAILLQAKDERISLIFMGTHGHSLFASAFFGRTVRDTILRSPVPVVTVRFQRA